MLSSRVRDLRSAEEHKYQRRLARALNEKASQNQESGNIVDMMKATIGDGNQTQEEFNGNNINSTLVWENIMQSPMWIPASILPFLIKSRTRLKLEDLKKIKSEVLMSSQFYCTSWDSTSFAGIYRGSFVRRGTISNTPSTAKQRSKNEKNAESLQSEIAFQEIQERLNQTGLTDTIQLFLMNDPEWRPGFVGTEPPPVILAISSNILPEQAHERNLAQNVLSAISLIFTLISIFAYAVSSYALNPVFFKAVVDMSDLSLFSVCLPIVLGVLSISLCHELGHFIASKISGVKIGLPVLLPSLQLGTFGCITPLRNFPDSRKSLFDFAATGPLSAIAVSIIFVIYGLLLTIQASASSVLELPAIPAALFKSSFLVGTIVSAITPKLMTLPLSQPVPIHPFFLIGLSGIFVSAVNLLPIGRLDGGRMCIAVFGRRSAYLISLLTTLFLAISALTGSSTISIFWGLLVTLFQRTQEIPVRDDLTEVSNSRFVIYAFCILFTTMVLAPFPGGHGSL